MTLIEEQEASALQEESKTFSYKGKGYGTVLGPYLFLKILQVNVEKSKIL